jgi:23S rRNA (pseudouridine1915-N3)-methyltransferase
MRLRFLWIGKTKNADILNLIAEYEGRVRHFVPCDIVEARDLSRKRSPSAEARVSGEERELAKHLPAAGRVVALDEKGRQFSSESFSVWMESEMNRGSRSVTFVIGGPEGLSPEIIRNADMVLSLGKMTWTHEMCRVLLLEQVYRALCILRGIPYHRT